MPADNSPKIRIIYAATALACIGIWFFPAIPQDPNYHLFVDSRSWLGIPNAGNVLSNLPFIVVGLLGLYGLIAKRFANVLQDFRIAYWLFFTGVFLTGFGSSYYHWNPNNSTLVWDRLPMTLSFMPFFCIIWAENISVNQAKKLIAPLIAVGIISVLYWQYTENQGTENQGTGDLRLYALVQFLPMLLIPYILLVFSSQSRNKYLWWVIVFYLLAKAFEALDDTLYRIGSLVSGHSVKHLSAALGTYFFVRHVQLKSDS